MRETNVNSEKYYKIYLKVDTDSNSLNINSDVYTQNLSLNINGTSFTVGTPSIDSYLNAYLGSDKTAINVLTTTKINSMSNDLLRFSIQVQGYTNFGDVWFYVDPQIDSNIGFSNNKYVSNCSYRKNIKDFNFSSCSDVPEYSCCFFYEVNKNNEKIKCIPTQPNVFGKSECKSYDKHELASLVGRRKHAYYSKSENKNKSADFIDVCDNMIINPDATISGHWANWDGLRKALMNGTINYNLKKYY